MSGLRQENTDSVDSPPRPSACPKVAVVMAVFNRWRDTERSLKSLAASDYPALETIVVDSGSTDETCQAIQGYAAVHLPVSNALWWAGATNAGIRFALGQGADYVLIYDCGVAVFPDTITHLVEANRLLPGAALAATLLDEATERVRWSGKTLHWMFPLYRYNAARRHLHPKEVGPYRLLPTDTIYGRVSLVHRRIFERVGLFREELFPHYMADIDWSLRAGKAGIEQYVVASARALEFHSPQVHHGRFRAETFLSQKSPENFRDNWVFFKTHSRGRGLYGLLFLAFYLECFWRMVRRCLVMAAKAMLGQRMFARLRARWHGGGVRPF